MIDKWQVFVTDKEGKIQEENTDSGHFTDATSAIEYGSQLREKEHYPEGGTVWIAFAIEGKIIREGELGE